MFRKIFQKKNFVYLAILVLAFCLFLKTRNRQTYNVISTNSKYEWENRDRYSFYKESREYFKYYYKNIDDFKTLNNLVKDEPNLHTLVNFKIRRMPFRQLFLGNARFIVNDYISEKWFAKKDFHAKNKNEIIQYPDVLKEYNLNERKVSEIEKTMKKASIEVINRYDGYVELCWESAIDDTGLDWYSGYLLINDPKLFKAIKSNYRNISQIDDHCYFFYKTINR